MNLSSLKKQQGAVLAFSLVMLLLLTLAGTRMIQQNKQQLEMAGNTRLSAQKFSDSEGFLADAKNQINSSLMPQHIDPTGLAVNNSAHQCIPTTGTFKQNIGLAQVIPNSTVTILSVKCFGIVNPVTQVISSIQTCSTYNEGTGKVTCKTNTDCKTIDDAIADFTASTDICYQDYDPQADKPNSSEIIKGKCPKEVYNIKVIATDADGTTRQIISDHVVGCGS